MEQRPRAQSRAHVLTPPRGRVRDLPDARAAERRQARLPPGRPAPRREHRHRRPPHRARRHLPRRALEPGDLLRAARDLLLRLVDRLQRGAGRCGAAPAVGLDRLRQRGAELVEAVVVVRQALEQLAATGLDRVGVGLLGPDGLAEGLDRLSAGAIVAVRAFLAFARLLIFLTADLNFLSCLICRAAWSLTTWRRESSLARAAGATTADVMTTDQSRQTAAFCEPPVR